MKHCICLDKACIFKFLWLVLSWKWGKILGKLSVINQDQVICGWLHVVWPSGLVVADSSLALCAGCQRQMIRVASLYMIWTLPICILNTLKIFYNNNILTLSHLVFFFLYSKREYLEVPSGIAINKYLQVTDSPSESTHSALFPFLLILDQLFLSEALVLGS